MSDFDFGFTAVDEHELEAVQQAHKDIEDTSSNVQHLEDKVNNLYNAILPLLSNLKANPEKEYIFWPNRTEKIELFEEKIRSIVK
jgi:uncharacterized protein Yka (UPF0111/DUF47 family)